MVKGAISDYAAVCSKDGSATSGDTVMIECAGIRGQLPGVVEAAAIRLTVIIANRAIIHGEGAGIENASAALVSAEIVHDEAVVHRRRGIVAYAAAFGGTQVVSNDAVVEGKIAVAVVDTAAGYRIISIGDGDIRKRPGPVIEVKDSEDQIARAPDGEAVGPWTLNRQVVVDAQ